MTKPPPEKDEAAKTKALVMPVSQLADAGLGSVSGGGPSEEKLGVISQSYSGPVPPVSEMRGYKEVSSSLPERIMCMAEKEQDSRHAREERKQSVDEREQSMREREQSMREREQSEASELKKSGQNKAFYALLIILGVLLVIVWRGETVVAAILAGTTIVGVVGMFIAEPWFASKNATAIKELTPAIKALATIKALPMKENEADS